MAVADFTFLCFHFFFAAYSRAEHTALHGVGILLLTIKTLELPGPPKLMLSLCSWKWVLFFFFFVVAIDLCQIPAGRVEMLHGILVDCSAHIYIYIQSNSLQPLNLEK